MITLRYLNHDTKISYKVDRFPDGTLKMSVGPLHMLEAIEVTWLYDNDCELMELIMLKGHLDRHPVVLRLPYMPNARMDRVKDATEVFTLKHFAGVLNYLNFARIDTIDAHSDVCMKEIERCNNVSAWPLVEDVIRQICEEGDVGHVSLVFPDKGSWLKHKDIKVAEKYIKFIKKCYYGEKNRDWVTGEIKNMWLFASNDDELEAPYINDAVLIVDDIISYGGTMLRMVEELKKRGVKDIFLYATHVEDSILKGVLLNDESIKKVYTTNSIYRKCHPKIQVVQEW